MKTARRIMRFTAYAAFFLRELVVANVQMARLVLSPGLRFHAAALRVNTRVATTAELVLVTNSITLTPGTLVMDVDLARREILVHAMSAVAVEAVRAGLADFPEGKALWAMRGER